MIDRDEMLRLVRRERDEAENGYAVSQHGSEAVTVWRRRADVLLAIESFIRTAPDPEKVKRLVEISSNIATQNNRATADPIFIVQQKVRDFGFEPSYADEYIWIDEASEEVGDPELIAKLEASDDEEVDGLAYHKVYYKERMEYVTACFTERGCLDYIEQNRHRMKDPN